MEPQAFGGPLTEVAQGTLVNQALDELADTPLHAAVEFVYDIQLRNAISHNDYDLTTDRTKTLVLHPDDRTLSWEAVWEVLGYAQDFHQGLLGAIATVVTAPQPEDWLILREYGVTSLDWLISRDGPIEVVLHQLWCFAELDPDGCWLDAADFTICKLAEGDPDSVAVRFGTAGFINVPKEAGADVLQTALDQQPWLLVTRYPVAPFLGLGYPRYTEEFEVVGTPDEHIVGFAGVETIDPANLAPRPLRQVGAEEQQPG